MNTKLDKLAAVLFVTAVLLAIYIMVGVGSTEKACRERGYDGGYFQYDGRACVIINETRVPFDEAMRD